MATQESKGISKATPGKKNAAAEHRRKVKEVKTKLQNLSPRATAEVVNEVVTEQVSKQFGGFKDFLREQSVIGIGIGLVLGTQVKTVVDTIMLQFVNPVTALFLPGQATLASQKISVSVGPKHAEIGWGAIVYTLFSFVMIAFLVYAIYKILRLDKLAKKKDK
jgi:large conductance mechanosensitive channel